MIAPLVSGSTHVNLTLVVNGTRYLQTALFDSSSPIALRCLHLLGEFETPTASILAGGKIICTSIDGVFGPSPCLLIAATQK